MARSVAVFEGGNVRDVVSFLEEMERFARETRAAIAAHGLRAGTLVVRIEDAGRMQRDFPELLEGVLGHIAFLSDLGRTSGAGYRILVQREEAPDVVKSSTTRLRIFLPDDDAPPSSLEWNEP